MRLIRLAAAGPDVASMQDLTITQHTQPLAAPQVDKLEHTSDILRAHERFCAPKPARPTGARCPTANCCAAAGGYGCRRCRSNRW